MTQPLVSIVIPVFNVEHHLRQCLDSVLRQTLKDNCYNTCSYSSINWNIN